MTDPSGQARCDRGFGGRGVLGQASHCSLRCKARAYLHHHPVRPAVEENVSAPDSDIETFYSHAGGTHPVSGRSQVALVISDGHSCNISCDIYGNRTLRRRRRDSGRSLHELEALLKFPGQPRDLDNGLRLLLGSVLTVGGRRAPVAVTTAARRPVDARLSPWLQRTGHGPQQSEVRLRVTDLWAPSTWSGGWARLIPSPSRLSAD
jgi:hypothetical protein